MSAEETNIMPEVIEDASETTPETEKRPKRPKPVKPERVKTEKPPPAPKPPKPPRAPRPYGLKRRLALAFFIGLTVGTIMSDAIGATGNYVSYKVVSKVSQIESVRMDLNRVQEARDRAESSANALTEKGIVKTIIGSMFLNGLDKELQ
jgi:hypothetical protein